MLELGLKSSLNYICFPLQVYIKVYFFLEMSKDSLDLWTEFGELPSY